MVTALVALLPLALAFLLLTVFRQSSQIVGLVALGATILLVCLFPPFRLSPLRLLLSLGTGAAGSLTLLTLLLPALFLYQLQRVGGTITHLIGGISRLTANQDLLVLLLVFGLAPFLDAICGMNVGIFMIAPILLSMALPPLCVACLCMISQITSAWGSMGIVTLLVSSMTGVPSVTVGSESAILLFPATLSLCAVSLLLSGKEIRAVLTSWLPITGTAIILTGGAWIATYLVGVEMVGVLTSLATIAFLALLGRVQGVRETQSGNGFARVDRLPSSHQWLLWKSGLPYAALTAILLLSRVIAPLKDWLQTHDVLTVREVGLVFPVLYLPGLWLLVVAGLAVLLLGLSSGQIRQSAVVAWRQFAPSATAIVSFLAAAQTMQESGMVAAFGNTALALGQGYVWVSPVLGAVSGWATGSAISGNSLLAPLQKSVALHVGLPISWIVSAQNTASSLGKILSPTSSILAVSAAGIPRQEGLALRKIGLPVLWTIVLLMEFLSVITRPSVEVGALLALTVLLPVLLVMFKQRSAWGASVELTHVQPATPSDADRAGGDVAQTTHAHLGKRSRDVLAHLAQSPHGLSRSQLSAALGQSTTTVHRLLQNLQAQGYVRRERAHGLYLLAHPVPQLQQQTSPALAEAPALKVQEETTGPISPPVQAVGDLTPWPRLLPHLEALAEGLQEVVYITVLGAGQQVQPVAVAKPKRLLRFDIECETLLPLYRSGCGKVLLAYQREEVRALLVKQRGVEFADIDPNQMLLEAQLVRHCGYAVDDEELEVGVRSLAVPLQDHRGVLIAALAVSGPVSRLLPEKRDSVIEALQRTSMEIAGTLRQGNAA